ncbi:hypothetical protein PXD56_05880 [Maribacter sp. SA7]|uniref:hypothetical protein n=1 Tax=Maribacter zhoushanensis TaxID=3030012 RepID=UPI0023ED0602|nr:hypothetical protein [Maribacter zhoushanensis]MDF4202471.1 hypothetical protein [Maribacter zhoushanensis]
MQKTILFFVLGILSFNFSNSQDYYVVEKDTIHCENLNYTRTAQGYLKNITYKKEDGTEIKIKEKKILRNVTTLFINEISIDRVPLKPSKPDKYVRYLLRSVDGKIKTYSNDTYRPTTSTKYTPGSPFGDFKEGGSKMDSYHYTIKMPNGGWYDIRKKKNMNNIIKPFLLKCEAFKKEYKGDYNAGEARFNETIELYNSLCQ